MAFSLSTVDADALEAECCYWGMPELRTMPYECQTHSVYIIQLLIHAFYKRKECSSTLPEITMSVFHSWPGYLQLFSVPGPEKGSAWQTFSRRNITASLFFRGN